MAVDLVLAILLVGLAGGALFARRLFACILLFITFGLLLSLSWVRLQAVDLALAEAAIGAGLTGALLLSALSHISDGHTSVSHTPDAKHLGLRRYTWMPAACVTAAIALLLLQVIPQIAQSPAEPVHTAARLAHQHVEYSGVTHPVTAVLLNFRAWDTLLELAVVVLALVGIRQLQPGSSLSPQAAWPLLIAWSKVLAPVLYIVAAYLLWRGKAAPGGAFQAGAVLAAAAVLLRLAGVLPPMRWSTAGVRLLAVLGLAVFMVVAAGGVWWGKGWLHYPPQISGALILLIEVAASLSIALALALMIVGEEKDLHQ